MMMIITITIISINIYLFIHEIQWETTKLLDI